MSQLVVSRKANQTVDIYDGDRRIATVKVMRFTRGAVRLGIEAKANVKILRGELDVREPAGAIPR